MNKLPNQYGKTACLYKDNIQDQAFKTWFEPIKSVELTDALYIVPSIKFFLRMVRRALCKITKSSPKELGKTLSYFIKLRWKILTATNNRSRNNYK
jgi:chromosomal replication initiator protein